MHVIAALNRNSSEKVTVFSPPFVCRWTDTGAKTFTAGAGAGAGAGFAADFLAAGFLAGAFFAGAFFFAGALFFAGAFFLAAVFGAAVFLAVGISPPIAFKVSITGCCVSWFDTDYRNSIVLCGRAGNCLV
jgi:hypothetical protein